MTNFLGGLICKWKGHKWRRTTGDKVFIADSIYPSLTPIKVRVCARCKLLAPVKTRAKKDRAAETDANQTRFEEPK